MAVIISILLLLVAFIDHENICIDTHVMALPLLVFEILAKVGFSIMAVLILIFCKIPKGAKRASSSF